MKKVVHLPCYDDNPYQELLISAQRELGWEVTDGGGGGNFIGVALRDWNPDVVHFHWLHPYLLRRTWVGSVARSARFLLEVLILKLRGSSIAWTIHNLSNHDGRYTGLERFFTAFFARLVDVPITHTREAGRLAAQEFGFSERSLVVTRHPGYTSYYPNTVTRTEARRRFGYVESEMVFLFLGRIQPYKGIFNLIAAFASLPESCRLVIAGTPADEETSKRIADASIHDPRIQFHPGHVSREEVQWFFQSADCVVFPFRKILSSGSVMLAMSFGKPLIAPDLPVIRETMAENDVWWFDPDNADSLRSALNQAANTWSPEMGQANLQIAKSLTWEKMAKETLDAYADVQRGFEEQ
jgi:beta-1,4-mannosyltransferase